jgi:hypothetical protein
MSIKYIPTWKDAHTKWHITKRHKLETSQNGIEATKRPKHKKAYGTKRPTVHKCFYLFIEMYYFRPVTFCYLFDYRNIYIDIIWEVHCEHWQKVHESQ